MIFNFILGTIVATAPVTHADVGAKFGTQADDYEKGRMTYRKELMGHIAKEVNKEASILDLGCGTGIATRQLYEYGFKDVKGLDVDYGMLEKAKNNPAQTVPAANYYQGNVLDIQNIFPNEKFDVMTAFAAFHWFCTDEAVAALKTALKPNGMILITGDLSKKGPDRFWALIESIMGSPVHDPRGNYDPIKVLEDAGFTVTVHRFETECVVDFDKAIAKRRSFSGWCNMTEEQKIRGEPLLQDFVRKEIAAQNRPDGKLLVTKIENLIVAKR